MSSSYLVTLSSLTASHEAIVAKEVADKALIDAFSEMSVESPAFEMFNAGLLRWAGAGFPDVFPVYTITLSPPAVCSDGVARPDLFEYMTFLGEPSTLADHMAIIDAQLEGMTLSYSYTATSVTFFVRKT